MSTNPQPIRQPVLFAKGPAPRPAPKPLVKVPYGEALRHIVRTVNRVLNEEQVMLGDGPTQDLISTIYIDAAKRCGVIYDFTQDKGA